MKRFNKQILEAITRGIQIALDDYQDIETNKSISHYDDVINSEENIKNLIEFKKYFVDLGLPSGTIWAKYNLGVDLNKLNTPEDWYGNYYAWAELTPKDEYNTVNYKFKDQKVGYTKYSANDTLWKLQLEDDAAYNSNDYKKINVNKVCIPTKDQAAELIVWTERKLIKNYNGIHGLNVVVLTSIKNGNEIIFPLSGYKTDLETRFLGETCQIWINCIDILYSNFQATKKPVSLGFRIEYTGTDKLKILFHNAIRTNGINIRPVIMK